MDTLNSFVNKNAATEPLDELERAIQTLERLAYEKTERMCSPLYPWVLVRLCARTQKIGAIWTPESDQNKTVLEGTVLVTWDYKRTADGDVIDCSVAPGDHVLFNHYAGVPLTGHKDGRYRFIKERDFDFNVGGIFATVEYADRDTAPLYKLRAMIENDDDAGLYRKIADQFILVDRDQHSVTLSGR